MKKGQPGEVISALPGCLCFYWMELGFPDICTENLSFIKRKLAEKSVMARKKVCCEFFQHG